MTSETSTYTYEGGGQETVTLSRGPATPHGHALLEINYSDGRIVDCYVNTEWLRERLDQLDGGDTRHEPRPLTPDDITDEMIERAARTYVRALADRGYGVSTKDAHTREAFDQALTAALTVPTRPEGAEEIEALIEASLSGDALSDAQVRALADYLAPRLTDPTRKEA